MDQLKVTFVGHIDHGKSTLSGRLLYDTGSLPEEKMEEIRRISRELGHETEFAYLMDHLSEEREQSMTIDTTQIFFHTATREYVIIDAPGHKEFLKNMITGASQADAAVLLLDVKEGIMEQTRRHAFLLGLLGLGQHLVAVNKMDLVGYDEGAFQRMRAQLLDVLAPLKIAPQHVIPLAAKKGENVVRRADTMPWYRGPTLVEALDGLAPATYRDRPLRFPVQDVYPWVAPGIAAGRLEAGALAPGMRVTIEPAGVPATVREIRKFLTAVPRAETGECVGVLLDNGAPLQRGQMLCAPDARPAVTRRFEANVFWLDPRPFRREETLMFRLATQDVPCRIERILKRIDSSTLAVLEENAAQVGATEVAQAILTTEQPVVLEAFAYLPELGRFALEKGMHVVAGGIVTQPRVV